jgi:hypothetical protein
MKPGPEEIKEARDQFASKHDISSSDRGDWPFNDAMKEKKYRYESISVNKSDLRAGFEAGVAWILEYQRSMDHVATSDAE